MRFKCTYQQHAVVKVTYTLDVPMEIVGQGEQAVRDWCDQHETGAAGIDTDILEYLDRVDSTFKVEEV